MKKIITILALTLLQSSLTIAQGMGDLKSQMAKEAENSNNLT
jgi:hypothetical protein